MNTTELNKEVKAMSKAETTAMTTFSFKDERLTKAAIKIAEIADNVRNRNIELAKVLGVVKSTKCYTEDGFRSVQDFAEQTFGIAKSMAYQLANVGERFYAPDASEKSREIAAMLPPSNLAELLKMDDKAIDEAMKDGKITPASTQAELRELAKSGAKEKVLKQYDVSAVVLRHRDLVATRRSLTNIIEDDIAAKLDIASEEHQTKKYTFQSEDSKVKRVYNVAVNAVGDIAIYTMTEATVKPKYDFTREELLAMIAELDD